MTEPTPPTQAQATPGQSPLSEASPLSMDELFSRDPLDLSKTDISAQIAELRRYRAKWQVEEAQGKTKASSGPKAKAIKEKVQISLADLNIKL